MFRTYYHLSISLTYDIQLYYDNICEFQCSYTLSLSPPSGRGKLGEPQEAEILLVNDVECSIGFPQPLFETKGDVDTLLLPVVREGPKGRSVTVCYQMIGKRLC